MMPPNDPLVLRTTGGDVPLQEYHLRLEGRAWRILHTGAILSHADEERFLLGDQPRVPYGIVLWPAAIALAHDLATRPLRGTSVLELGAGTGLPGIVAASLGARVVQTDRQELALHVCEANARRNERQNGLMAVEHRLADWTAWDDKATYDWIVGSDILYAQAMHPHLREIFDQNLARGGRLLLADPFRKESFALLETMEADGWEVSMTKWTVGISPPERAIGVFELRHR